MTTPITAYVTPLAQAAFAVNGFEMPVVTSIVDSQGKHGYRAYAIKPVGERFEFAELLSPRSADDAVDRLAREILRNR